jgi:hypothetical protein
MTVPEPDTRDDIRAYGRRFTNEILPVLDPARLTTQVVDRAISAFREVIEARLIGMDRAIAVIADQVDKLPADAATKCDESRADINRQMLALRELIMSQIENVRNVSADKFDSINGRFRERDAQLEQAAREGRISLDSALTAAKDAVSEHNKSNERAIEKAETATQKQIEAMLQLMTTSNRSLEERIGDLKTRLDRGEGQDTASTEARNERRVDVGSIIQAVAVMATIAGLIIVAFHK